MRYNKKALELSVNVIVLLIVGLTVMGLAIAFVTDIFSNANDIELPDNNDIGDVKNKPGNLAISSNDITLQRGGEYKTIAVKLRNAGDNDFNYEPTNGEITNDETKSLYVSWSPGIGVDSSDVQNSIPQLSMPKISLSPGEEKIYPIQILAGNDLSTGTYNGELIVEYGSDIKETEIITVEVE